MGERRREPQYYDIGDRIELSADLTAANTRGSIESGFATLYVQDASELALSDVLLIPRAGTVEGDLIATITGISGNVVTLDAVAGTSVTLAPVGVLVSPAGVTCVVQPPSGSAVSLDVENPRVGHFTAEYEPELAGSHWYAFAVNGVAHKGEEEQQFVVRENRVA